MTRRFLIMLACGSTVITLSMGARQVFGLFLVPVTTDLDMSRQMFGLIVGLQNLVWGLTQPVAGLLADRFGTARVASIGGIFYVSGLALASFTAAPIAFALTIGSLIGLAQSGTAYAVVLGAIGRAAPPHMRSLAVGIASTAGSVGMFTLVPLTQGLIATLEWQTAMLVLAALTSLIPLLSIGLREKPSAELSSTEPESVREALSGAVYHSGFWMLTAGFAACGFQLAFLATYLPSILSDAGLGTTSGAAAFALIGFSNIIGTYLCGVLGGWYRKKKVLAVLYLARTALFVVFLSLPTSQASAMLFAVAIGLIWTGTVPLTNGLVGDIFGTRHLGMLFGVVYIGHQLGAFVGAWAGGFAFDQTGSYTPVWLATVLMGVLAAILHWPIRDQSISAPLARAARA